MIVAVEGLHAGYGEAEVLHGIDLVIEEGAVTALVGANGAGKTTLMKSIAGLVAPRRGHVRLRGEAIERLPTNERVARGVSLVPEGRMVFPSLSVEENLRLGAIVPRARANADRRREAMYALFPRLAERRRQSAGLLSGGEQQMLAIARALMAEPKVLLLDEPCLGLAPLAVDLVFQTVRKLRDDGLTILMAEQDVPRALEIADRAHVVEHGRIVLSGEGRTLLGDERVKRAYLGV